MESFAQPLWNWSSSYANNERDAIAAEGEEDLESYLAVLAEMVGADQALLTFEAQLEADLPLHAFRSRNSISESGRSRFRLAMPSLAPVRDFPPPPSAPEWAACMFEERPWVVLRMSIPSRRARSSAALNFLFQDPSPNERALAVEKLQTVRSLIDSFVRLWQRTRAKERRAAGLQCALNIVDVGILLLNKAGKLTFANKAGEGLLDASDPIRRVREGITACDPRQSLRLEAAINYAIASNDDESLDMAHDRRALVLALNSARPPRRVVLSVVPAERRAIEDQDVAAIVYILDPETDVARQLQTVCRLFALSPAEARLATLLTVGKTLQEAAKEMRVKDETARTYLKHIFLKTDTRRQADLVRVLLVSLLRIEPSISPTGFPDDTRPSNAAANAH